MQGYLSLDLETTGLDPKACQILQISAIWDDLGTPVNELKHFTVIVDNGDNISGNPYALSLNAWILNEISKARKNEETLYEVIRAREVSKRFTQFLFDLEEAYNLRKLYVAGKNAAGFDIPFLKEHFSDVTAYFKHRVLDPGSMYAWLDGETPVPDQSAINRYLGFEGVTHDAYDDALDVIKAIRIAKGIPL